MIPNIPGSGNYLEDMEDQRLRDEQKQEKKMERKLFVGDIVISIVNDLLGNDGGTKGIVYEEYDIGRGPGASIIFQNGSYDGFSPEEQEKMVLRVGHSEECEDYAFKNVIKLSRDFDAGYFKPAFAV